MVAVGDIVSDAQTRPEGPESDRLVLLENSADTVIESRCQQLLSKHKLWTMDVHCP